VRPCALRDGSRWGVDTSACVCRRLLHVRQLTPLRALLLVRAVRPSLHPPALVHLLPPPPLPWRRPLTTKSGHCRRRTRARAWESSPPTRWSAPSVRVLQSERDGGKIASPLRSCVAYRRRPIASRVTRSPLPSAALLVRGPQPVLRGMSVMTLGVRVREPDGVIKRESWMTVSRAL
jgi:hypothetical protein